MWTPSLKCQALSEISSSVCRSGRPASRTVTRGRQAASRLLRCALALRVTAAARPCRKPLEGQRKAGPRLIGGSGHAVRCCRVSSPIVLRHIHTPQARVEIRAEAR